MVGYQFERMVDLMRQYLNKTAGKDNLSLTLNNRPLNYLEDDIVYSFNLKHLSIWRRNIQLGGKHEHDRGRSGKRAKYIKKCKDNTWNRWKGEYLKSL